jgi:hypothetical protein
MVVTCTQIDGKWMIEELEKEFNLPFKLLRANTYKFTARYGHEYVKVDLYDLDGVKVCSEGLTSFESNWVNFNQFVKFMKDRMHLPDLFSLVVTVPSEGIVSCEAGIFPQKRAS